MPSLDSAASHADKVYVDDVDGWLWTVEHLIELLIRGRYPQAGSRATWEPLLTAVEHSTASEEQDSVERSGGGQSAELVRHDVTLADATVTVLWEVVTVWWSLGEDGDAEEIHWDNHGRGVRPTPLPGPPAATPVAVRWFGSCSAGRRGDTLVAMTAESASYRSVFAVGEFRRLWIAHVLSVAGDQLARVALTVVVFDRTRSAGLAAVTYALTYLPDLVGGATLGGLADRFPRRTVMVLADAGRGGVVALMAVPGMPLLVQVVLLAVVQLLAVPFSAARQAVIPDILDGDELAVGLGVLSMTYQAALVIGFGGGAAVVAGLGTSGALWLDAATFAVSAAVIRLGLAAHAPPRERTTGEGQWAKIRAGWRVVATDARLRSLLALACCSGWYVVPEGLAVPYAAQLGGGPGAVGWLLAANPVGMVAGMLWLKRLPTSRRLRLLGPLAVATSVVLLPTGWGPGLVLTVALWALSGALSAHNIIIQTEYVAATPAPMRGRAVGLAMAALRAAQGVAIVAAGLLAQLHSPAKVIAAAAAAGVLVAGAAAVAWSRAASPTPAPRRRDEAGEDLAQ